MTLQVALVMVTLALACEEGASPGADDTTQPPDVTADVASADGSGYATPDGSPDATPDEVEPECATTSTTTLAGVMVQFTTERCRYTLAEAAAGLTIPYQVLVSSAWEGVIPRPQDAGGCDDPGPAGLILFERLSGGDQHYCVCDTGLCMPPDETPIALAPGAYPAQFTWDGVNWAGPSDTGNPKGAPFPAGTYTLEVSARGKLASPPGTPFEVKATLTVILE